MTTQPDARRLGPGQEAQSQEFAPTTSPMTLPPRTPNHPKAVAPAYAVFVLHDDGRVKRRRVLLSLHSAIKAQERAEARGERFELMLVELVPVPASPVVVVGGGTA